MPLASLAPTAADLLLHKSTPVTFIDFYFILLNTSSIDLRLRKPVQCYIDCIALCRNVSRSKLYCVAFDGQYIAWTCSLKGPRTLKHAYQKQHICFDAQDPLRCSKAGGIQP